MYRIIRPKAFGSIVLAASCLALAPSVVAKSAKKLIPFQAPTDKPAPRRASTSQGASRGLLCSESASDVSMSVKALLPENHYGITAMERPTIVAYLPATSATEVFVSIKDEAKQLHFETTVPISGKAGLLSFQLPETAPALETDKHYQWFLAVKCNGVLRPSSPFVDGWIQRVLPNQSVASVMTQPSSVGKAASLGKAGFWYDTLETLADLKQKDPADREVTQSLRDMLTLTEFNDQELDVLVTSDVL